MSKKRLVILGVALLGGFLVALYLFAKGTTLPLPAVVGKNPTPVTFYRWQDSTGAQHFSSEPPPAGVAFETTKVDGVLTNMDAPKPAAEETTADSSPNPLAVYTPGGMAQMLKDSKNATEALRNAQEQQRRTIEAQQ